MTGTHSPEPSSSNTPSSSTSPPRRPPRATPPTQPLPPVPGRPPLNPSLSSPPRIPSRLSGNTTSRKDMNSPKLAPSPLSPPATTSKPRAPGRPDLRQTVSANDTRTSRNSLHGTPVSPGQEVHRTRSTTGHVASVIIAKPKPPPPPPSSFPASKAVTSSAHASAILPSFLPFDAADDDLDTTELGARNDMSSDSSRAPTPQSRFHSSHSSKFLSKIRAKASAHALRSSPPTTESSGFSSPRTSEETLTELFDEDLSSGSIKAVIRQRARTLSRSSPVPQAPSKLRLSKNLENRSSVRFPEEDDSPTDCEEDAEGLEDASFATVKAPAGYQRPSCFEVKDVVIRNGMRVAPHPVWEVPYPVGFSCAALQSDDKTYDLVKALQPDRSSPSFYHFKHAPSMVLDLGCGVGRWVIEAAAEWTKTRFVGLDLMDLQPDLSEKQYEDIRDRVQWVHNNFVHFKLPFPDAHFDFIRMSFVALAVPESKWRFLVKEIRRVLKPSGVLEWIDEEPVFAMSPSYCPNKASTFTSAKQLQSDFTDMLRARRVDNALRCFSDELKGLKGLFEMTKPKFDKFKLWLPGPGTELQSRSNYELGLMRSGSPAALMRSGSPAGTTTRSRTHQMARELKRTMSPASIDASASARSFIWRVSAECADNNHHLHSPSPTPTVGSSPPKTNNMSSNVFVQRFMHLKEMPREKEALAILQKVASLVKPIMRKHGWVLPVLAEFYPENPGLLDINGGQKICLRLRPYFDKGAFLRQEEIIGTMLHELTHNVRGPHDQEFYKFLSKLEDEYDALQRSGYAGEGFFSRGNRVGEGISHNPSPRVARERALAAAEKRRQIAVVMNAGNKKLGGNSREGKSMRQLAAEVSGTESWASLELLLMGPL
ncbi:hypothetical protein FRC00_005316 [Tulasnella sp. 408]|nr:hypothetical protein FRC00_005316 [Tulasnella sp. 408]